MKHYKKKKFFKYKIRIVITHIRRRWIEKYKKNIHQELSEKL
jgi:hypothetical protein